MISWGDIGGKRKPSRFTPVSPTLMMSYDSLTDKKRIKLRICTIITNYVKSKLFWNLESNFLGS
jgi:hypothetical protein